MLTRLRQDEDGFALITAVAVVAIMMILLVMILVTGQSSFEVSERNSRFTRTLGIAEAGANDAVTMLGESRTPTNPCDIDSANVCTVPDGEYQIDWEVANNGTITIDSIGYFPSLADQQISRHVRVVLEPESIFKYALFSESTLDIKNDEIIRGDIFANQKVTLGTNAIVCGSITNASGGVETQNGAAVVTAYDTCTSEGDVWAGGTINLGSTGTIQGDATASAPSDQSCPPVPNTTYAILGGSVGGTATACGAVTTSAPSVYPNTATAPSPTGSIPAFTFDPSNYPDRVCYAVDTSCAQSATSATAVFQFSTVSRTNMQGEYVIWQTNATQSTVVSLDGLSLSGDLTIITNAPIDFGNTSTVTTTQPATLTIISLYVPPTGTQCDTNGGDCSIYAKNQVVFDAGVADDPSDGIALFVYTPGKMAFKNLSGDSSGEGALYAGSMDLKNGFAITYNSRIERTLGFGVGLEQTLWQEISD